MSTISATVTAGNGPNAIVFNTGVSKYYVANQAANTCSVFNNSNAEQSGSPVTTGRNPIAMHPNASNGFVLVANGSANTVTKINGTTQAVTSTIAIAGGVITDITGYATGTTSRAFVAQAGGVTSIRTDNDALVTLSAACNGKAAINPISTSSGQLYVLDQLMNHMAVINLASGMSLVGYVPLRTNPSAIAVNATTNKIYVANFLDNSITVLTGGETTPGTLDPAVLPTVTRTIKYGNGYTDVIVNPCAIAVNATTNIIYVAQANTPNVLIIDGSTIGNTYMTTRNINVGINPQSLAVDISANRVYVVSPEGYITTISGASAADVSTASVATILNNSSASLPSKVAVNAGAATAYVSNNRSNNVTVVSA